MTAPEHGLDTFRPMLRTTMSTHCSLGYGPIERGFGKPDLEFAIGLEGRGRSVDPIAGSNSVAIESVRAR